MPNGSGVAHSHSKSILADTSTKKTLTKCVKSTIDQGALQRTKTLLMIERSNYFSRDLEQLQLAFMIFIPLSLWFISAACQPESCLGSQKKQTAVTSYPCCMQFSVRASGIINTAIRWVVSKILVISAMSPQ